MARQPVQTPGDTPANPTPGDTATVTTAGPDAAQPTLADTATTQQQVADLAAASAGNDAAAAAAAENAELRAQLQATQQQVADLARIVRKSVENSPTVVEKPLPTVEEVMKQNPKQPVLTDKGHYCPPSENWAVSAGNSKRPA